jgi:hypothetical protein
MFPLTTNNPEPREPEPMALDAIPEAAILWRTIDRALQSGRQGRCWREGSGWTLRGKPEPRRAGAVGIWSAGLLASAGRSDWTLCPIPSRASYRASFGPRRRPAARLGIGGRATDASISVYMGKCGESGSGSWQSGVLSHPHARPSTSCLVGLGLGLGGGGGVQSQVPALGNHHLEVLLGDAGLPING